MSYNFCNKLFHGCGIAGMRMLDDDSIPLVVTSPPFGSIRDYGGHPFYFKPMARELWRVAMPGGIVCWHVQDQMTEGAESGESFRQCLYFLELGFRLHTTLTVDCGVVGKYRFRYGQPAQYVFVLSKGKPRLFNPIRRIPNASAGKVRAFKGRLRNGTQKFRQERRIKPFRKLGSHWTYPIGVHSHSDPESIEHPAPMPESLAEDLIASWSSENDLVLDPMSGAGTTAKMAFVSNRCYLGFEINREYHDLAVARMEKVAAEAATPKLGRRIESDDLDAA